MGIVVIDHASTARGAITPIKTIIPAGINFFSQEIVFLDKENDVLYVGGDIADNGGSGGVIAVFNHASTLSGIVTPDQTIISSDGVRYFTIDTQRKIAYVINAIMGVHRISLDGSASDAYINLAAVAGETYFIPIALTIDQTRDRLYMVDNPAGIRILNHASTTASGYVANPDGAMINIPQAQSAAIDANNDRLYVGAGSKVYILNAASTLVDGDLPPSTLTSSGPAGASIGGFAFP
jgi:hypothetical protein